MCLLVVEIAEGDEEASNSLFHPRGRRCDVGRHGGTGVVPGATFACYAANGQRGRPDGERLPIPKYMENIKAANPADASDRRATKCPDV